MMLTQSALNFIGFIKKPDAAGAKHTFGERRLCFILLVPANKCNENVLFPSGCLVLRSYLA